MTAIPALVEFNRMEGDLEMNKDREQLTKEQMEKAQQINAERNPDEEAIEALTGHINRNDEGPDEC
jgi:hypothetical protein